VAGASLIVVHGEIAMSSGRSGDIDNMGIVFV